MADDPLTARQRAFVQEMLILNNATRSYMVAYRCRRRAQAAVSAHRLLRNPTVAAELTAARRERSVRTDVRGDHVLAEFARIAFADILDVFDASTGLLRNPRHIPFDVRRAITGMQVIRTRTTRNGKTKVTEQIIEIRMCNKLRALDALCRHLGLDGTIPPIESLLLLLPRDLAEPLRAALTTRPDSASANGKQLADVKLTRRDGGQKWLPVGGKRGGKRRNPNYAGD